jgi:hypothetical protein
MKKWNLRLLEEALPGDGHLAPVTAVAMDRATGTVLSGDESGGLLRWDPNAELIPARWEGSPVEDQGGGDGC